MPIPPTRLTLQIVGRHVLAAVVQRTSNRRQQHRGASSVERLEDVLVRVSLQRDAVKELDALNVVADQRV